MTTVLCTGITGTWGEALLASEPAWKIRGFSRDEHKQALLAERYPDLRLLIGDVRDLNRLKRAMEGCDTVIHAAALKHVTACEKNPGEALKTNAVGTMNVAEACLDTGVQRAVFLSSDKAVHPVNVYGATKATGEKCWLASNAYGGNRCKFSVVRYGNVKGSRGSVLTKESPRLTDARATRFWMEPHEAVDLVLLALREMQGGEVFVPKLRAARVVDEHSEWAAQLYGDPTTRTDPTIVWATPPETGLRPGEKLHETLISDEEVPRTLDFGDHYRIVPTGYTCEVIQAAYGDWPRSVPPDFSYTSEAVSNA